MNDNPRVEGCNNACEQEGEAVERMEEDPYTPTLNDGSYDFSRDEAYLPDSRAGLMHLGVLQCLHCAECITNVYANDEAEQ